MRGEPQGDVPVILEGLFRRFAGQLTATLSFRVGRDRIDLIEEVIQETLLTALKTWPTRGIPDNPEAWLFIAAKNRLIDALRKEKIQPSRLSELDEQLAAFAGSSPEDAHDSQSELLRDDLLRCIFACCHPSLTRDAQATLTLRLVCGFNAREIGRMLLTNEGSITRRITRAKESFRQVSSGNELFDFDSISERLDSALDVIYFLLNAGHTAPEGNLLIRADLAEEALYLATMLSQNERTAVPKLFALLSLIHFHLSRLPARIDTNGRLLTLEEQDRTLWDREHIARGVHWLERSASGDQLTEYHLQAAIAAVHASSGEYETTDWRQIVEYYDMLVEINSSPVIALNRAIAVSMLSGSEAGIALLDELKTIPRMEGYYLFHAVQGELLRRSGKAQQAISSFEQAATLAGNDVERKYLERRILECKQQDQ